VVLVQYPPHQTWLLSSPALWTPTFSPSQLGSHLFHLLITAANPLKPLVLGWYGSKMDFISKSCSCASTTMLVVAPLDSEGCVKVAWWRGLSWHWVHVDTNEVVLTLKCCCDKCVMSSTSRACLCKLQTKQNNASAALECQALTLHWVLWYLMHKPCFACEFFAACWVAMTEFLLHHFPVTCHET